MNVVNKSLLSAKTLEMCTSDTDKRDEATNEAYTLHSANRKPYQKYTCKMV